MKKHRLNSVQGEIRVENYIKMNNSDLDAKEVAKVISRKFNFNLT